MSETVSCPLGFLCDRGGVCPKASLPIDQDRVAQAVDGGLLVTAEDSDHPSVVICSGAARQGFTASREAMLLSDLVPDINAAAAYALSVAGIVRRGTGAQNVTTGGNSSRLL